MPPTAASSRTTRASCRVGCVLAVLLVTAGGLRLLAAAESVPEVELARTGVAVHVAPEPASGPAVYEVTTADFVATVERAARAVECSPLACGYPRMAAAVTWQAPDVSAPALPAASPVRIVSWVPPSPCGLACPERMRAPEALRAAF